MFRVKLTVPPERVLQYIERVKTGIRGIGYVRLDDSAEWPERLNRHLPEASSTLGGDYSNQSRPSPASSADLARAASWAHPVCSEKGGYASVACRWIPRPLPNRE